MGPDRLGAGPIPFARRSVRILVAETRIPSLASSPRILRHPQLGFSLPIRRMNSRTSSLIGGLPPAEGRLKVHFLRTSSRCHRRSVWGLTPRIDHRARGRTLLMATMNSRSRRRRRGLRPWRLRTISWWRRTTTSMSLDRSPTPPANSRTRRRSSRYTRAKTTDRTSHVKEARSYELAG